MTGSEFLPATNCTLSDGRVTDRHSLRRSSRATNDEHASFEIRCQSIEGVLTSQVSFVSCSTRAPRTCVSIFEAGHTIAQQIPYSGARCVCERPFTDALVAAADCGTGRVRCSPRSGQADRTRRRRCALLIIQSPSMVTLPLSPLRRSLCTGISRVGRRTIRGRKIFADGSCEDLEISARALLSESNILPRDLRLMVTRTANLSARPDYFLCRFPPLTSIVTSD